MTPDRFSKSSSVSCPVSSSPISVLNENDTGSPAILQLQEVDLSAPTPISAEVATWGSYLCENLWREPGPSRSTAMTEVRKEMTERSWKRESDRKSLMVTDGPLEGKCPFVTWMSTKEELAVGIETSEVFCEHGSCAVRRRRSFPGRWPWRWVGFERYSWELETHRRVQSAIPYRQIPHSPSSLYLSLDLSLDHT